MVKRSGAGSNGIATSPTRGGIPTITDYLLFGILGLGSGAVVSFIAVGIVLAYRGSGVINFAQGAMAMYCAYVFVALRRTGRYLLPVPGLPGFIDVGPAEGMALAPRSSSRW